MSRPTKKQRQGRRMNEIVRQRKLLQKAAEALLNSGANPILDGAATHGAIATIKTRTVEGSDEDAEGEDDPEALLIEVPTPVTEYVQPAGLSASISNERPVNTTAHTTPIHAPAPTEAGMFGLKRWDPEIDGKHLPGLKGRAGTGNSATTQWRNQKKRVEKKEVGQRSL
ncbi:hypothetical protein BJ508DRAFT_171761 [Ascobolus immersus RN42]|uniref:Uncharacterized protein n=1 Tax=Ascobolus immersus RN42 TaxID=1160509 RepID=A0A3N4HUF5_ASCIM|nr:hypothetical protein BJ508DRAFT_171761 [Ascobolus immersus RN42]